VIYRLGESVPTYCLTHLGVVTDFFGVRRPALLRFGSRAAQDAGVAGANHPSCGRPFPEGVALLALVRYEEAASYNGLHPNRLLASLSETKLLSSRSIGQVARQCAEH
jgi:hypothetical protein